MQVIGSDSKIIQRILKVRFIGLYLLYTVLKKKTKGGVPMKSNKKNSHLTVYKPQEPTYPNAADHNYFAAKALNVMTAIVSGMGFATAMVFLATMA